MRLAHLNLLQPRLVPYSQASVIQETLVQRQFSYKDSLRSPVSSSHNPIAQRQPDPAIITFTPPPTYTVGRRYLSSSSSSSSSSSNPSNPSNPSTPPLPTASTKQNNYTITPSQRAFLTGHNTASFHPSPRGGDLTFHGPGQLVAYPLIDLRRHGITPRNYIRLLEEAVMRTCVRLGVPDTETTENPGVWIRGGERKVCAVGVQVRRGITGHGIALNVTDEEERPALHQHQHHDQEGERGGGGGGEGKGTETGGMLSWGFGRIVACGLQGKKVTWLAREGARHDVRVADAADVFVDEFARGLQAVESIYQITEAEVLLQDEAKTPCTSTHPTTVLTV